MRHIAVDVFLMTVIGSILFFFVAMWVSGYIYFGEPNVILRVFEVVACSALFIFASYSLIKDIKSKPR